MKNVNDIQYYPKLNDSVTAGMEKTKDPDKAAKQVEVVFLNELLKNMLENTEFGKEKMVSGYMPYITTELSKSLSQRGIGIQEFFMKSPAFKDIVTGNAADKSIEIKELNAEKKRRELTRSAKGSVAADL